ncbi:MAG: GerW family sporulation protein [Lachnospiraceae bacterium]|nr:GerW family sporulation protein [Lachnospiraceae bacterium]MCR5087410.1 GerW family sporulation protein [Lachnospiraceae bacterium]
MADVNFGETVSKLLEGMEGFVSTKSVVGDARTLPDGTVIIPLVDVAFAVGAGAFNKDAKNRATGAIGGKMSPCAVLILRDDNTRLITIKDQDTLSRIFEMLPDVVQRVKNMIGKKKDGDGVSEEEIDAIADEIMKEDAKD